MPRANRRRPRPPRVHALPRRARGCSQRGARRRLACSTSCAARRPAARRRSGRAADHRRPRRQVARARASSAGSCSRSSCSWSPRRSSGDGPGLGEAQLDRRRLRADEPATRSSCSAPTPRAKGTKEPGATVERPEPLGLDPAPAHRRRAQRASSRSRATRSSTSPATAATRSTPPTRSAARRSRSARSSSTSASRSTTSSRSTSRTSPQLIDAIGGDRLHRRLRRVAASTAARKNGGYTLRLQGGHAPPQRQAGARARPHAQEPCNPREDDLTRARRQQKILAAIKDRVISLGDVLPAAVGLVGRRRRRSARTWAARRCSASLGARAVGGSAPTAGAQAAAARDAARRRRRPGRSRDAEKRAAVGRFLAG